MSDGAHPSCPARARSRRGSRRRPRAGRRSDRPGLTRVGCRAAAGRDRPARRHPGGARPGAGRGPRRGRRVPGAGGGERRHDRDGDRPGPDRLHAARRGLGPQGRAAVAGAVRRVHAAARGERDHRALQHPGRAGRRRHHRAAPRHRQRRRQADDDAHLAVRLALQPVPVLQRPARRPPAPGLVDHRVPVRPERHDAAAGDHDAVPAEPLLRRGAPAARPDLPRRRHRAAHGTDGHRGVVHRRRPARLRAGRVAARRAARRQRARVRRRPARPARRRARVREGDRAREGQAAQGVRAAGRLPGQPAHHRGRRDDRRAPATGTR